MKINETCRCGALIETDDEESDDGNYVTCSAQITAFRKHHEKCIRGPVIHDEPAEYALKEIYGVLSFDVGRASAEMMMKAIQVARQVADKALKGE